MMVTGDYHHTAIAVARGVSMIPTTAQVVIVQSQAEFQMPTRNPGAITSVLKSPRPKSQLSQKLRSVSFHVSAAETSRACVGLKFFLDNGDVFEDGDMLRALTSIAQVPEH